MADVRSMLRAERAARAPQSARSVKSVASRTSSHPITSSRKRKATDNAPEVRKRARAEEVRGLPAGFFDGDNGVAQDVESVDSPGVESVQMTDHIPTEATDTNQPVLEAADSGAPVPDPAPQPPSTDAIDEDEWAAFERDVATPPPERSAVSALNTAVTIQAAPISAAELAAQAREEQSTQRGRREAEIEAEREDAARHLEEEFDEMAELEARVQKLREKREAIRRGRGIEAVEQMDEKTATPRDESGDESDDEYDEEDFDDWRFGAA